MSQKPKAPALMYNLILVDPSYLQEAEALLPQEWNESDRIFNLYSVTDACYKDVKPGNVIMVGNETVKMTDFGLMRSRPGSSSPVRRSRKGTIMVTGDGGTPASPELVNQEPLTRREDFFSWGLSVFEMFKGDKWWQYGDLASSSQD